MNARTLNICIEKLNRTREYGFHHVRCLLYQVHITVRMRQFQRIWIPDGHYANNKGGKGSSGQSAVKWRNVGKKSFWVAVSCGENFNLLDLFIFQQKFLKCVHYF
jgi:hypothetical protein